MIIFRLFILQSLFISYLLAETIGLLSGSNSGTYIKIARDIAEVSKDEMNIKVYNGGSLKNIEKVLSDKHSQFAIVQYDALLYKRDILGKKDLSDKIKMIFPLYNEEIHIIARTDRGINSVRDLAGKKVNMDRKNSGSWVTATMIKKLHKLNWMEFNYSPKDALLKLTKGEIDAFIYVVGQPAPILSKLPKTANGIIKLIFPDVSNFYPQTKIEKNSYKWLKSNVKTNTTKALFVTYNYGENRKIPRFDYYLNNIKKMAKVVNNKLTYLRNNKHPKWKEINPYDIQGVKWPVHKVVNKQQSLMIGMKSCEDLPTKSEQDMCNALKGQ